jgi:hypothetical protein
MNVFISYRRNDTQDLAGRIADRIRRVPQVDSVFIDVEEIEPGADFAAKIRTAVSESTACILLIGPDWRGVDRQSGAARICADRDFVRLEAAAALTSEHRVLPVLANGAAMPLPEELPDDLRRLPAINALSIRHAYFEHDIEYLIDVLLARKKPGTLGVYLSRHPVQAVAFRALAGACAALALLILAAAVHGSITGRSLDESLGGQGQVWLLIAGVLAAGMAIAVRRGVSGRSSR